MSHAYPSPPRLLDQPDGTRRAHKAVWRQIRAEVSRELLVEFEVGRSAGVRVSMIGGDDRLAAGIRVATGLHVTARDLPVATPVNTGDHAVIVVVAAEGGSAGRIDQFRQAKVRLAAGGHLIVVATVVADPSEPFSRRPPAMSGLVEEIMMATGAAVHLDELRSFRWHQEPYRRAVVLSLTALTPPRGW